LIADKVGFIVIVLETASQKVREKENFQDDEHDEELDQYDEP
jgi:hypothetical protein